MFKNLFNFSPKSNDSYYYIEVHRNEKCYCGSGKKFKQCHLEKNSKARKTALYQLDKESMKKEIVLIPNKKMRKGLYPIMSESEIEKLFSTNI